MDNQIQVNMLTQNEISLLVRFLGYQESAGYAEGVSDGPIIKSLKDKGLMQPFGRDGRRTRWQVNNSKLTPSDREQLQRLNGTFERIDL